MTEHDWKMDERTELNYCTRCYSTEGATTTECPGESIFVNGVSDRVYHGEIDFRNGEWCNQPAAGMSHAYGTSREPYVRLTREDVGLTPRTAAVEVPR